MSISNAAWRVSSRTERVRLRCFFDAGSGVCFWSGDAEAYARFGDAPVSVDALGLDEALITRGAALIARYDTCIDWSDPGGPLRWSAADAEAFFADARAFLTEVRAAAPDVAFDDEITPLPL